MAEQTIITLIHPLTGATVLLDTRTGRIMLPTIHLDQLGQHEQTAVPPAAATQEPWHIAAARTVWRTIEAYGWDITWTSSNPVPDDAWPVDIIARALLEARER